MTSAITVAHGDFDQLDVHPVAGNIGAEVRNISLSADLSDDVIQQIENALVKYKVLFFRRQHQLTDEAHQAFGARFGKIVAHPTVPSPEGAKLFEKALVAEQQRVNFGKSSKKMREQTSLQVCEAVSHQPRFRCC